MQILPFDFSWACRTALTCYWCCTWITVNHLSQYKKSNADHQRLTKVKHHSYHVSTDTTTFAICSLTWVSFRWVHLGSLCSPLCTLLWQKCFYTMINSHNLLKNRIYFSKSVSSNFKWPIQTPVKYETAPKSQREDMNLGCSTLLPSCYVSLPSPVFQSILWGIPWVVQVSLCITVQCNPSAAAGCCVSGHRVHIPEDSAPPRCCCCWKLPLLKRREREG